MCGPSFRESVEDVDKINEMMAKNRKLTIGEMAANLNIAYECVQDICVKQFAKKARICGNHVTRGRTMPSLSANF